MNAIEAFAVECPLAAPCCLGRTSSRTGKPRLVPRRITRPRTRRRPHAGRRPARLISQIRPLRGGLELLALQVTHEGDRALQLVGPDGILAETTDCEPTTTMHGDEPGWLAAQAVGGSRIARAEDARWCLAFLDRLEGHLDEHGRFAEDPDERRRQRADHAEVLERARAFYRGIGPGTLRP